MIPGIALALATGVYFFNKSSDRDSKHSGKFYDLLGRREYSDQFSDHSSTTKTGYKEFARNNPNNTFIPTIEYLDYISSESFLPHSKEYYMFRANVVNEWGWLMYLQELLSDDIFCIVSPLPAEQMKNDPLNYKITDDHTFTYFTGCLYSKEPGLYDDCYVNKGNELLVYDYIFGEIDACLKGGHRFIVCTLHINGGDWEHDNALIFDTHYMTLTRFEPHGSKKFSSEKKMYDKNDLDNRIRRWLNDFTLKMQELGHGINLWTYSAPLKFCANLGPKSQESWNHVKLSYNAEFIDYEERILGIGTPSTTQILPIERNISKSEKEGKIHGLCDSWALFYMNIRLTNPHVSDIDVISKISRISDQELSEMIRRYAQFITKSIGIQEFKKLAFEEQKKQMFRGESLKIGDYVTTNLDKYYRDYTSIGRIVDIRINDITKDIKFIVLMNYNVERDEIIEDYVFSELNYDSVYDASYVEGININDIDNNILNALENKGEAFYISAEKHHITERQIRFALDNLPL
jgi:hypothetical protein